MFRRLIMRRFGWLALMLSVLTLASAAPALGQVEKATVNIDGMI